MANSHERSAGSARRVLDCGSSFGDVISSAVWPWQDSGLFRDDVGHCQSQTQSLIRGLLVYIARSILLRELTVRAAKKTAASHGAESWSRVQVAFLSCH